MMRSKWFLVAVAGFVVLGVALRSQKVLACCDLTSPALAADDSKGAPMPASFYALSTTRLNGQPVDLKEYAGKVALVVNTASKCGFTPQYKGLQELYTDLSPRGFVILGFPSNDFGGQEPGTAEEIKTFCELNYKVTFPMFSKVVTKAGPEQSPIYTWLGQSGNLPQWNFSKYVIGKDGRIVAFFPSKVTPDAPELRDAIEKALK
jgi:glutathione peroxidase